MRIGRSFFFLRRDDCSECERRSNSNGVCMGLSISLFRWAREGGSERVGGCLGVGHTHSTVRARAEQKGEPIDSPCVEKRVCE